MWGKKHPMLTEFERNRKIHAEGPPLQPDQGPVDLDRLASELQDNIANRGTVRVQARVTLTPQQEQFGLVMERHIRTNPLIHLAWVISMLTFDQTVELAAGLQSVLKTDAPLTTDSIAHSLSDWKTKMREEFDASQRPKE